MRNLFLIIVIFTLVGCNVHTPKEQNEESEISSEVDNNQNETENNKSADLKEDKQKSVEEIVATANEFPIKVVSNEYIAEDPELTALYPAMVLTVFKNESDVDVRDIVYSIISWDENDLPVKIKSTFSFNEAEYVGVVEAADVNLIPGGQTPDNFGLELDSSVPKLEKMKVVVEYYVDFEDNKIFNEGYKDYVDVYEGKKLTEDLDI